MSQWLLNKHYQIKNKFLVDFMKDISRTTNLRNAGNLCIYCKWGSIIYPRHICIYLKEMISVLVGDR